MTDTTRLPPADDVGDLTGGEVLREVLFFATVIGAIAGGGYGLFAGYADWRHAAADVATRKSALIIPMWGLIWAVGGAAGIALLCGSIVGIFLGASRLIRRIFRGA
jgi:hypothetical protein